ncbi:MAG: hypothetical protein U9Q37_06410 [Euryarchaeota archaeon]|nr:hypothetical protein [Euryarchaeota archaeon]
MKLDTKIVILLLIATTAVTFSGCIGENVVHLQSRPINDLTCRYDVTRLTTDSAGNADPVWSHDGSKIFFRSGPNIGVMDPDGGNVKTLTRGAYPALSRDGSGVFFRRIADEERELWVMNPDRSDEKRVVSLPVTDDQHLPGSGWALSPVGARFAITHNTRPERPFTTGTNLRQISG